MIRYIDPTVRVYSFGNARLCHQGEALYAGWYIDPDGSGGCYPLDWTCSLPSKQLIAFRDQYAANIPERDARRPGMLQAFRYAIEAREQAEIHTVVPYKEPVDTSVYW